MISSCNFVSIWNLLELFLFFLDEISLNILSVEDNKPPNSPLTCCHQNYAISYIYLAANWYVGWKIQHGEELYWDEFNKYLKILMVGEKTAVSSVLSNILTAQD